MELVESYGASRTHDGEVAVMLNENKYVMSVFEAEDLIDALSQTLDGGN